MRTAMGVCVDNVHKQSLWDNRKYTNLIEKVGKFLGNSKTSTKTKRNQ